MGRWNEISAAHTGGGPKGRSVTAEGRANETRTNRRKERRQARGDRRGCKGRAGRGVATIVFPAVAPLVQPLGVVRRGGDGGRLGLGAGQRRRAGRGERASAGRVRWARGVRVAFFGRGAGEGPSAERDCHRDGRRCGAAPARRVGRRWIRGRGGGGAAARGGARGAVGKGRTPKPRTAGKHGASLCSPCARRRGGSRDVLLAGFLRRPPI